MIPRLKADLRVADLAALIPSSDRAVDVASFEESFSLLAGQKHAVAFSYGRTAQIAILKALARPGAEVICPSYTCVVVPHAIVKAGMVPVFVDSKSDDFNMDWEFVHQATGPETAAVIATSIFGHPVNGVPFREYTTAHPEMIILQDCAHGFFAGNAHHDGLAAFYGLNISKIITSIFGGIVTTDDDNFAARLRQERDGMLTTGGIARELRRSLYLVAVLAAFTRPIYGLVNLLERSGFLDRFVSYYDPSVIDLPDDAFVALGGVEARTGLRQIARYHTIVAHRRMLAGLYRKSLTGIGDLRLPPENDQATISHFVIRTSHASAIKDICLSNGIQVGVLIEYDCADMPTYRDARYFGERRSRTFAKEVVNLPVHVGMTKDDVWRLCDLIRHYFNGYV